MAPFGTKQISKAKGGVQKAAKQAKKAVTKAAPPKPKVPKSGTSAVKQIQRTAKKAASAVGERAGGVGYRKYEGDALWLPNTERPEWLDGTLPGVRWHFAARSLRFAHVPEDLGS
jgi:hypothetical protein